MEISNQVESSKGNTKYIKIKRSILIFLISLTVIQQFPVIKDLIYSEIRSVLYLGFMVLGTLSFSTFLKYTKSRFIYYFSLTVVYSIILMLLGSIVSSKNIYTFEMLVPFGIFMCSISTSFNSMQLRSTTRLYVALTVFLGLSSIFFYGEGFQILDTYFLEFKNQIGPILGIATTIVGISIMYKEDENLLQYNLVVKWLLLITLFSSIVVIRNRASMLALLIIFLVSIAKKSNGNLSLKKMLLFFLFLFFLGILLFSGGMNKIVEVFNAAFFKNFNINDMDAISAGRLGVYREAVNYVLEHPIWGSLLSRGIKSDIAHNYVLNKLVEYGILGALPFNSYYIYLWIYTLFQIFRRSSKDNLQLPFWVLLFSLIVSLFEYSYPFGPGVSQVYVWFLLGQHFKNVFDKSLSLKYKKRREMNENLLL